MNNAVFEKTMQNVRKQRDINILSTKPRRNYLVLVIHYHTTKIFSDNLLVIEIKRTQRTHE